MIKKARPLSKNYVTDVTVTTVGLAVTCTWHEPNVRLHRGGIARTPLRPSSRIEPRSKLVPRCAQDNPRAGEKMDKNPFKEV